MIHTVLFDVGGTLIDAPDIFETLTALFTRKDTDGAVCRLIKDTFNSMYLNAANRGTEFLLIEEMLRRTLFQVSYKLGCEDKSPLAKEVQWDNFVTNSRLCDDTIETLERLKAMNVRMIVTSDADAPLIDEEFRMYGLTRYFERLFISSEVKAYKPSDKFVSAVRQEICGALDGVLIIGDSKADIITGEKLGIHTALKGFSENLGVIPEFEAESPLGILKAKCFD